MTAMNIKHLLAVLLLSAVTASAGGDTLSTLEGVAGGGYVYNISDFEYGVSGLRRNGGNAFARVLWSPEHILDVGLEFGFTNLYGIDPPASSAVTRSSLVAYPIYIVASMTPLTNFSATVGFGTAILSSVVETDAGTTGTTSASTSVFGAIQYMAPVADKLQIGGELRLSSFDRYRDANVSFNVLVSYSLVTF